MLWIYRLSKSSDLLILRSFFHACPIKNILSLSIGCIIIKSIVSGFCIQILFD